MLMFNADVMTTLDAKYGEMTKAYRDLMYRAGLQTGKLSGKEIDKLLAAATGLGRRPNEVFGDLRGAVEICRLRKIIEDRESGELSKGEIETGREREAYHNETLRQVADLFDADPDVAELSRRFEKGRCGRDSLPMHLQAWQDRVRKYDKVAAKADELRDSRQEHQDRLDAKLASIKAMLDEAKGAEAKIAQILDDRPFLN